MKFAAAHLSWNRKKMRVVKSYKVTGPPGDKNTMGGGGFFFLFFLNYSIGFLIQVVYGKT
jgi:hypothetical protein